MSGIGADVKKVWDRIIDVVMKSIFSVQAKIPSIDNCFEIFGYDILLDSNLNPYLLEVNRGASLEGPTPLRRWLRSRIITDTLNIVGVGQGVRMDDEFAHASNI